MSSNHAHTHLQLLTLHKDDLQGLHKAAYHTPLQRWSTTAIDQVHIHLFDSEGIVVSRHGIATFIEHLLASARHSGSSRQRKITLEAAI